MESQKCIEERSIKVISRKRVQNVCIELKEIIHKLNMIFIIDYRLIYVLII